MNTPVCDFVRRYAESGALRLHMPGHKGCGILGTEKYDITEISGADSLYEATGIIRESEENASRLFGSKTYYSAEGSSICIRAMLYLICMYAKKQGRKPLLAAGRNAHKAFLSAAALLDFEIRWLYPENSVSYLSCEITAEYLEKIIEKEVPAAVYITSPDYLGNVADIRSLSEVCHKNDVLLIVDNAHGSYLKFLPESLHPIDLGADICCDSAHKTLPVITGGAYLHISHNAPEIFCEQAKNALAMFGSTSPSYLILQSLDYANKYISQEYDVKLKNFTQKVCKLKNKLIDKGYILYGNEPLKITVQTKKYGYTGNEFSEILYNKNIISEFSDPDFCVMMLSCENGENGLEKLEKALLSIQKKTAIEEKPPLFSECEKVLSVRDAAFSESEIISVSQSEGRVLAAASVGCPPAVPIVICGEKINENAVKSFFYYGIEKVSTVKENTK